MTPEERLVALIGEKEAIDLLLLLRAAIEEGRAQARAEALEESAQLRKAAQDLIDDVRRRYPGEELRCPYMIALDRALHTNEGG